MTNNRLEIFKSNSKTIYCSVVDASENAVNIEGYNAYLYGQKFPIKSTNTIDISILGSISDASNGIITFDFTVQDSSLVAGDYVYNVNIEDVSNNKYITVINDRLTVLDILKK